MIKNTTVTNYESSKDLFRVGFRGRTNYFCWIRRYGSVRVELVSGSLLRQIQEKEMPPEVWPAYSAEELLEFIPKRLAGTDYRLKIFFEEEGTYIAYQQFDGCHKDFNLRQEDTKSLADCVSRLLVKLIEAKLVILS